MKLRQITTLLLLALVAISCNNSANHNQSSEDVAIELNNGEKWMVNAEMTPFILEGETILKAYNNGDYKMLAKQLKDQNNDLIKSCTMKGESHDELHKWLHPHMALVKELSKAESNEKASELITQLEESYKSYNQYFQ